MDSARYGRREDFEYDVFISYRWADRRSAATWLSRQFRAYVPPRGFGRQLPPLRTYLDVERERVSPQLWEERIRPALVRSRFLLVVLTPRVAEPADGGGPNWVQREIAEFLRLPQRGNVLLVRAAGPDSIAVPGPILETFQEPGWIDIRPMQKWSARIARRAQLRERVTALAVPLLDIRDEEIPRLNGLMEREKRRVAWSIAAVASSLLLIVSVLAVAAWWQRGRANEQARIAVARQLSAQANLQLLQDPSQSRLALLLALESLRRLPSVDNDYAVRQALNLYRKPTLEWRPRQHLSSAFTALAVDRNGSRVAVDNLDGEVAVILQRAPRLAERPIGVKHVGVMSFAPRSGALVTLSGRGELTVRDERGTRARATIPGGGRSLAFNADESRLAVSTTEGVHVLTFPDLRLLHTLVPGGDSSTARYAWYRSDGRVSVADDHGQMQTYTADGRLETVQRLQDVWWSTVSLAQAPVAQDGHLFAAVMDPKQSVGLFDADGREVKRIDVGAPVREIALSPDGAYLAVSNDTHMATATRGNQPWLRLFRTRDGLEVANLGAWNATVLAFSGDGTHLCLGSFSEVRCFAVQPAVSWREVPLQLPTEPSVTFVQELTSDGASVFVNVMGNRSWWHRQPDGSLDSRFYGSFTSDGRFAALLGDDGMRVRDIRTGRVVNQRPLSAPVGVTLSKDAVRMMMTDGYAHELATTVLQTATGSVIRKLPGAEGLALSPSGRYIAWTTDRRTVTISEVNSGQVLFHVPVVGAIVRFSPCDRYVAVVDQPNTVSVWSLTDRREIVREPLPAAGVAFAPDGNRLAIAGADGVARVLRLPLGIETHRIQRGEPVSAVQFTPDGERLWLAIRGVRLECHVLQPAELLRLACTAVDDNLSRKEWNAFIGGAWEPTCPQH